MCTLALSLVVYQTNMENQFSSSPLTTTYNAKSIAVLPFVNLSADPENEYFSDGITEEIINALTKVANLKVTARTSSFAFKGKDQDIREIARVLGVANILEGSVRKADNRVRITAQLIQASDGFHLWSRNFDRELADIFTLQDEISLLIADQIRENFGHIEIEDHLISPQTSNIEAYQLFLKGKFFLLTWNLTEIEKAISYFVRGIELDTTYEESYFSTALCYSILGAWGYMDREEALRLANNYLLKGTQLEKNSVSRYFCQAACQFWGYWDYRQAYENLQIAHRLNPQDPEPIDFMAEINRSVGDFSSALALNSKGLEVNPLSTNAYYTRATLYYLRGSFPSALDTIEKGLTLDPNFELLHHLNIACLILLGKKAALNTFIENNDLGPILPRCAKQLYNLFHGEPVENNEIKNTIDQIDRLSSPMLYLWEVYLTLYANQKEAAFERLKLKVNTRIGQVVWFKHDPLLAPIRDELLFKELVNNSFPDNSLTNMLTLPDLEDHKEVLSRSKISSYTTALVSQMEEDHIYRDTTLTLRTLADRINLHPNKLSWLLNDKIGKNFNDFVNEYRVQAFQANALNTTNQHLTLLGLAYESGFNSKSVFNRFFKQSTGTTPKAWVKSHRREK